MSENANMLRLLFLCIGLLSSHVHAVSNPVRINALASNGSALAEEISFAAHPQSLHVEVGQTAQLAVLLNGPVKSIQWRKNGENIEGANDTYYKTLLVIETNTPDKYDVVIKDAFGKELISKPALITGVPAGAKILTEEARKAESQKLQALFALTDIFSLLGAHIDSHFDNQLIYLTEADSRLNICQNRIKAQVMPPKEEASFSHRAVKLEMDRCPLPKYDNLGKPIGLLVSGTFIQSVEYTQHQGKDFETNKRLAKKLNINFTSEAPGKNDTAPVSFDVELDGMVTKTTATEYLENKNLKIKEEFEWEKGTKIRNPQSGVEAIFWSGRYGVERLGYRQGRAFHTTRETKYFQNLEFKINGQALMIKGLVNTIKDNNAIERSGNFEIFVGGKKVMTVASPFAPISLMAGKLPIAPKLYGTFLNEYYRPTSKNKKSQGEQKSDFLDDQWESMYSSVPDKPIGQTQ